MFPLAVDQGPRSDRSDKSDRWMERTDRMDAHIRRMHRTDQTGSDGSDRSYLGGALSHFEFHYWNSRFFVFLNEFQWNNILVLFGSF